MKSNSSPFWRIWWPTFKNVAIGFLASVVATVFGACLVLGIPSRSELINYLASGFPWWIVQANDQVFPVICGTAISFRHDRSVRATLVTASICAFTVAVVSNLFVSWLCSLE